jgi:hypothetical protein
MTKHDARATRNPGTTSTGAAAAAMALDTAAEQRTPASLIEHDEIGLLAYSYWEARGCPYGSPEEDWFRAEKDLHQKSAVPV